jgi:hypothetical protein
LRTRALKASAADAQVEQFAVEPPVAPAGSAAPSA